MNIYQYALRVTYSDGSTAIKEGDGRLDSFEYALARAKELLTYRLFVKIEVLIAPSPFWEVVETFTQPAERLGP